MAPEIAQLLVVLIVMPAIYNGIASSLHIAIVPKVINELVTENVKITCAVNDSPGWSQEILFLELAKKGEHPVVTLKKSGVKYGVNRKLNMEADGHIDEVNITNSYLRLIITNPGKDDAGVYVCLLFYMDAFDELKEAKTYANLTVDNGNTDLVFNYLITEVKELKKALAHQDNVQTARNDALEQKLTQEIDKRDLRDSFASAFSAGYDSKDTFSVGDTLVFSQSILDVGHDYDTSTGVYTAPRRGLYVFTLVVLTHGKNWHINIHLQTNGQTVASLYAIDNVYADQSSVSTVVSLQAGDLVKPTVVYIYGGRTLHPDDHFSLFSGYLLQPL